MAYTASCQTSTSSFVDLQCLSLFQKRRSPGTDNAFSQTTQNQSTSMYQRLSMDAIDKRWPWRVGWPRLRPQRMLTLDAMEVSPRLSQNRTNQSLTALGMRIDAILDMYSISRRDQGSPASLVYRTHKQFRESPPREHLRILVDCIYDPQKYKDYPDSWSNATIQINIAIKETFDHSWDIGIELCDLRMERSLHLSAFPRGSQEFQQNWETGLNYREQVLSKFERHPGLWQAMIPIGVEASNEQFKYHECVLWFDALDADDNAWPHIEEEINSLLPVGISAEIWQATGSFLLSTAAHLGDTFTSASTTSAAPSFYPSEIPSRDIQTEAFDRPPKPGSGIGVVGDIEGGGTLGGYVIVKKGKTNSGSSALSEETTYGVTNAHVALGCYRTVLQDLHELGKPSSRMVSELEIPVQSPCEKDRDELLDTLNEKMDAAMERLAKQKQFLAGPEEDRHTEDQQCIQKRIDKINERLESFTYQAGIARRQNLFLGDIKAAAFGNRPHYQPEKFDRRLAMDIALANVTDSVPDPKRICIPDNDFLEYETLGTWMDVDTLFSKASAEDTIQIVGKHGRTTAFTRGILHGIKVDILLPSFKKEGSAWAVRSIPKRQAFALPGDSGSFVFARESWRVEGHQDLFKMTSTIKRDGLCVVGLLFGTSLDAGLSYFIPFEAVKEVIEEVTGGEMTWPTKIE